MKSSARFERAGRTRSSSRTAASRMGRAAGAPVLSARDGASVDATAGASGSERRIVKSPIPAMTAAATTTAVSASSRRIFVPGPPWSSRRNHGKVYSDIRSPIRRHLFHTAIVSAPKCYGQDT